MFECEILTLEVPAAISISDIVTAWRNFRKSNVECKKKYGSIDSPKVPIDSRLTLALYRLFVNYSNDVSNKLYIFDSAKIASGIIMYKSDTDLCCIARAKISEQFSEILLSTVCNPSNHILLIVPVA